MTQNRRPIYVNKDATTFRASKLDHSRIRNFHRTFPGYEPTKLIPLSDLAVECKVKQIYLKDESSRFGLPAFKVLGASWGAFNAVASQVGLQPDDPIETIAKAAQQASIKLFAATDGNHGRAVSYAARLLSVTAVIYVPSTLEEHIKQLIKEEGGSVVVSSDYDGAVRQAAAAAAADQGGILVQDTAYPDYEDIPRRIVEGYSTMLTEVDEQLAELGHECRMVICPVGVGSLAEAVTRHFKSEHNSTKVVAIEPDTAACLWKSLNAGVVKPIRTSGTIMTGMECGTVSYNAWPILSHGVDYSLTLSDFEAHQAVQYLRNQSIASGPCGAAGVAAIRHMTQDELRWTLPDGEDTVVVLLNTEGHRSYVAPFDVSSDDPIDLTRILTQIESTNPSLSASRGSGEIQIANYIESWLQHRDIESYRVGNESGRPSVIGVVEGNTPGIGRSLMINGHIDTVSTASYAADPLGGKLDLQEGRQVVSGRGALDMKAGVAAGLSALVASKKTLMHKGEVILTAVADEEYASQGTEDVIAAGWRADGAVIPEPTSLRLGSAHKGFVWVELNVLGKASHGSDPTAGIDAIMKAGKFLNALEQYAERMPIDDELGRATLHCGLIHGGEEPSSYPAACKITIEFRTVPAQTNDIILSDLRQILDTISANDPQFRFDAPAITLHRPPHKLDKSHPFCVATIEAACHAIGKSVHPQSLGFWCDAALLSESGTPAMVFGPAGEGLHANHEWVDVESVRQTTEMLQKLIETWCA